MSAGYGPPAVNTFGMITGIGKAFEDSYDAARKWAQEDEAPALFGQLMGLGNPSAAAAPVAGPATAAPSRAGVPSFASAGGAMGDYLATTRAKESGGDDAAKNPASTATGRYQFTQGTWNGLAKKYPDLGLTPNGRTDPAQQERAMQAFTDDNAKALTAAGVPINPGNLYVSHFLGEAGGPRFIAGAMSNPDAPATSFVTPGAASANRTIFFNRDGSPKTAGEVYAERTSRYAGGGPTVTPTLPTARTASAGPTMAVPAAPAPTATASADMPETSAQPAGFVIPGQGAPPQAAPAAQGFAGFGSPASRITPEQQQILTAAWKNPVTRPMATAVYQQLLTGKASPWKMEPVNGVSSWVNSTTGQIVPVTSVGPRFRDVTDDAGNQFKVNDLTGERSLVMQAQKGSPEIIQNDAGQRFVVDKSNPAAGSTPLSIPNAGLRIWGQPGPDGQVIQPPPGIAAGTPGYYDAKGVPQLITGKGVSVTNNVGSGETEEAKEAGKLRGKRVDAIETSAMKAPDQISKLNLLQSALERARTGALGPTESKVVGFAQALGIPNETLAGLGLNPDQAVTSQVATKLTNELVTGMIGSGGFPSNNFSNRDREFLTDIFPKISNRPEANQIAIEVLRRSQQRNLEVGDAWQEYQQAQRAAGKPASVGEFEFNFRKGLRSQSDLFSDLRQQVDALPKGSAGSGDGTSRLTITPREANALRNGTDTAEARAAFDAKYGEGAAMRVLKRPLPDSKPAQEKSQPAAPVQGARQAPNGNWYVPDPNRPGKYLQVQP